jgi:6-phosphogluconolactonase (cycloisomerase 2 family)
MELPAMQSSTPTRLVASDARNHVFGVSVPTSGLPSLLSYNVSIGIGTLQQVSSATLNGDFVQAVLNPAGTFLFVSTGIQCCVETGSYAGFVASYSVDARGNLALVSGVNEIYLPSAPLSIAIDPTGTYLFAAEENADGTMTFIQYVIDSGGHLSEVSRLNTPLSGGSNLVISGDGKTLYWGYYIQTEIVQFSIDVSTGHLTQGNAVAAQIGAVNGSSIVPNASGTLMFQATEGESPAGNGVAIYTVGGNGLTWPNDSFFTVNGEGAPAIATDTTGQYLYVSGPHSGQIEGYSLNGAQPTPLPGSPYKQAGGGGLLMVQAVGAGE